ncbi:hypothetical protein [Prevotella sp. 10(H)]|uniref:hypothetical protein n=1 Tax=Prevotella sp. 10(H) TaxID=1158294 RepID=UPI000691DEA9|nr:hypothetical protein [Prevotella sp. 10(H)]
MLVLLFAITTITFTSHAQVTIGSGSVPEKGALLELKEKTASNPDKDDVLTLENSDRGLLFPKVSLKAWNKLTPLYGGKLNTGTGVWGDDSTADEKLRATGMIVYNINTDAVDLEEGLYMWRIEEWVKLSGGMGQAQFDPLACSNIEPMGTYIERKATTGDNYLLLKVNVIKPGTFAISVTSGNGYNFYLSGVILEKGPVTLQIPSQGTPINVQIDKLKFDGIELLAGCEPEIEVVTNAANYDMNCFNTKVNGEYRKGHVLDATNTITLLVNVRTAGSYAIKTPVVNGVSFTASGEWTSAQIGMQPVTMMGMGTPTVNFDFPIDIISNSPQGNTKCSATVPIILPRLKLGIIGQYYSAGINGSWYSWWSNTVRFKALNSSANFGATQGVVKTDGFETLWQTASATEAVTHLASTNKPDIILYYSWEAPNSAGLTSALAKYVNDGGVLVFASNSAGNGNNSSTSYSNGLYTAQKLVEGIFGSGIYLGWQDGGGNDDNYYINNLPNDPVVNGPFGNLAGKLWGEDNDTNGTVIAYNLPPNSVQVCSAQSIKLHQGVNPKFSTVWYNESKNFFMFGDTFGATAPGYDGQSDAGGFPAYYDSNLRPQPKQYSNANYTAPNIPWVYNSALEMNVMAWAVLKAVNSGINPH